MRRNTTKTLQGRASTIWLMTHSLGSSKYSVTSSQTSKSSVRLWRSRSTGRRGCDAAAGSTPTERRQRMTEHRTSCRSCRWRDHRVPRIGVSVWRRRKTPVGRSRRDTVEQDCVQPCRLTDTAWTGPACELEADIRIVYFLRHFRFRSSPLRQSRSGRVSDWWARRAPSHPRVSRCTALCWCLVVINVAPCISHPPRQPD